MLVEFRVKNFRSLRDEQVLSLVASTDKTLLDSNTLETSIKAAPRLLCSAAIYGANAGGKSTVIRALQYMRGVVLESAALMQPGQTFAVQPFRLDNSSTDEPTEFEVTFILDGVRYQYGFSMTQSHIVSEYLLVYKASKPQRWFERHYDASKPGISKDAYEFGPGLHGPKNVWSGATRPNSLFLSMAVQLNSESLRPVFDWFANSLVIFNEQAPPNLLASIQMLKEADGRQQVCDFLTSADISIADIEVETRKVPGQTVQFDPISGRTEIRPEEMEQHNLKFSHVTETGNAVFEFQDESSGTRLLLFLAGPIVDALNKGVTLVVDELHTSLHTLLVRELVRLFHNPARNRTGAQLIFTTHDTSLLDAYGLFRRDQVWFVEKDRDQASTLVPLTEFSPRKHEALERGYLMGRYGGVPFLADDLALSH